jgi:hypothetical protein
MVSLKVSREDATEDIVGFDQRGLLLESTQRLLGDAHGKESVFDFALLEWFFENELDSLLHDFPHRLAVRISKVDKPPPSKLLAYRDCQLPFIPYHKRHFSIGNGVVRERQWYDFVERQSEMEEGVEGL